MLIDIADYSLLVIGIARSYMVTSSSMRHRYIASVTGFVSQPIWMYVAIHNRNYGIMLLSVWYTYCWLRGMRNNKRNDNNEQ